MTAAFIRAESITRALGGQWHGRYGTARCPAHEDRSPSLSIANGGNGQLLVKCFAGCDGRDVLAALRRLGLLGSAGSDRAIPEDNSRRHSQERADAHKRTRQALTCWAAAEEAAGTLVERYLRARAYAGPVPTSLRFHGSCWHQAGRPSPAMVAAVQRGDDIVAVHRTYLVEPGRKADIEPVKASLGPISGGAVRLSAGAGRLVVAEGIETGLSLLSGLLSGPARVWAALSAPGMRQLLLPPEPSEIIIAADGDLVGRDAAQALGERAYRKGWRVSMLPAPDGRDWNDLLLAGE